MNQAYEVDQSDEELDEFISELLTEISAREGELQRMAEARSDTERALGSAQAPNRCGEMVPGKKAWGR